MKSGAEIPRVSEFHGGPLCSWNCHVAGRHG